MASRGRYTPPTPEQPSYLATPPPNQGYIPPAGDWFSQNAPPTGTVTNPEGPITAPQPGQPVAGQPASNLPPGYSMDPTTGNGGYTLASFGAPGIAAPFTSSFNRPNPESIANDPSYKFQFQQGLDAIQRSAASRGTLLTGGTLKDLTAFGQGLASTFDDKYWNRELGLYDRSYDIFRGNQAGTSGLLTNLSSFGMQGAQGTANASVGAAYARGGGTIGQANATNTTLANVGNAVGEYLANRRARGSSGNFAQDDVNTVSNQIYGYGR